MTRMTGPDCAVMCNLINTHTHTQPHKTCRCHVGNGGDFGGKREKRRKERVGPVVASNPDNLENSKEAGGEHEIPTAWVGAVQTSRDSVSPLKKNLNACKPSELPPSPVKIV